MPSNLRTLTGWNRAQMPPLGVVLNEQHWAAPYVWGMWIFNAGAGNVVTDVSGHGMHLAANGGDLRWVGGCVRAPSNMIAPRRDLAGRYETQAILSGYVQSEGIPNVSSYLASRRTAARGCGEIGTSSNIPFLRIASSSVQISTVSTATIPTTRFVTIGGTWKINPDGTSSTAGVYVDGRRESYESLAITNSGSPIGLAIGKLGSSDANQCIAIRYGFYLTIPVEPSAATELANNPWGLVRLPLRRFYSVPAGGGVVTGGSAALAGSGALTLAGVRLLAATRALSGAGAATGTTARLRAAGVSLAGSGAVALGGARLRAVTAALTGAGYLGILGAAECEGHATLTIGAARVKVAAVVAAGAAGLTVGAVRLVAASRALHGAGALAVNVAGTNSILIAFLGAGTQGAAEALGDGTQAVVTRGSGTQTIEEAAP